MVFIAATIMLYSSLKCFLMILLLWSSTDNLWLWLLALLPAGWQINKVKGNSYEHFNGKNQFQAHMYTHTTQALC